MRQKKRSTSCHSKREPRKNIRFSIGGPSCEYRSAKHLPDGGEEMVCRERLLHARHTAWEFLGIERILREHDEADAVVNCADPLDEAMPATTRQHAIDYGGVDRAAFGFQQP